MNFNKAIIVGNLTRDPEVRSLPSGQQVVNFGIASNRYYTDQQGNKQEKTEFHNIVAFGKLADICSKYLKKGTLILVEGRLQTSNWDGQDGVKRYKTEIIMESMQMGPRPIGSTPSNKDQAESNQPPISQEEIPVIEAEEPLDKKESSSPDEAKEEVDVKNIPF